MRTRPRHRAFTLIELLVVIAIIALLLGILIPALASARKSARVAVCQSNMRQLGIGAANYSASFGDFIPSFSWKAGLGPLPSPYTDLQDDHASDKISTLFQAVSLLRERTGYETIPTGPLGQPWFVHLWFTHLTFLDFLSGAAQEAGAACPEDEIQTERSQTPVADYAPSDVRRKYESSYETSVVTFSVDVARGSVAPIDQHLQAPNTFLRGDNYLVNRRYGEVAFPSSKVHMFDTYDQHFHGGRTNGGGGVEGYLFCNDDAREPVLFFDSSVRVVATADSNPGFRPLDPASPEPTTIRVIVPGQGIDEYTGYYRWTRGGLRGIDFGGREVNTGQPRDASP